MNTTTYTDYQPQPLPRPQRTQQPTETREVPAKSFQAQSTTKADYVEHPVSRPEKKINHSNDPLSSNDGQFDGKTTQREDYQGHEVKKTQKLKPTDTEWTEDRTFHPDTTTGTDFRQHQKPGRAERFVPVDSGLTDDTTFHGHTTTGRDYTQLAPSKQQKIVHADRGITDDMNFYGDSTHRQDFNEKEMKKTDKFTPRDHGLTDDRTFHHRTTAEDYRKHQFSKQQKIQHTDRGITDDMNFYGDSTHRQDFNEKEIAKTQKFIPQDSDFTDDKTFHGKTTVGEDYRKLEFSKQQKIQHADRGITDDTTFYGYSTHRQDFDEKEMEKTDKFTPRDSGLGGDNTFYGNTTVREDFTLHALHPQERTRPQDHPIMEGGEFSNVSTHRQDFSQHVLPERTEKCTPRDNRLMDDDSVHGHHNTTTTAHDYQGVHGTPPRPFVPKDSRWTDDTTFHGDSTVRRDFQTYPLQKREMYVPKDTGLTSGRDFDGGTTFRESFREHAVHRPARALPADHVTIADGTQFRGTSVMKQDFVQVEVNRQKPVRHDVRVRHDEPFSSTTTFRQDFQKPTLQGKRHEKAPKDQLSLANDTTQFYAETTFRGDYTPKPLPPMSRRRHYVPGWLSLGGDVGVGENGLGMKHGLGNGTSSSVPGHRQHLGDDRSGAQHGPGTGDTVPDRQPATDTAAADGNAQGQRRAAGRKTWGQVETNLRQEVHHPHHPRQQWNTGPPPPLVWSPPPPSAPTSGLPPGGYPSSQPPAPKPRVDSAVSGHPQGKPAPWTEQDNKQTSNHPFGQYPVLPKLDLSTLSADNNSSGPAEKKNTLTTTNKNSSNNYTKPDTSTYYPTLPAITADRRSDPVPNNQPWGSKTQGPSDPREPWATSADVLPRTTLPPPSAAAAAAGAMAGRESSQKTRPGKAQEPSSSGERSSWAKPRDWKTYPTTQGVVARQPSDPRLPDVTMPTIMSHDLLATSDPYAPKVKVTQAYPPQPAAVNRPQHQQQQQQQQQQRQQRYRPRSSKIFGLGFSPQWGSVYSHEFRKRDTLTSRPAGVRYVSVPLSLGAAEPEPALWRSTMFGRY